MKGKVLDEYLERKDQADDDNDFIGRLLFELLHAENVSGVRMDSIRAAVNAAGEKSERSNELDRKMLREMLIAIVRANGESQKGVLAEMRALFSGIGKVQGRPGKDANEAKILKAVLRELPKFIPPAIPGKDANENRIVRAVLRQLPKPKAIDERAIAKRVMDIMPKQKPVVVDEDAIIARVLKKIPTADVTMPRHEYDEKGKRLRFETSPGTWGQWIDLHGLVRRATSIRLFTQLVDVPQSYQGKAGKVLMVRSDEKGLELGEGGGGAVDSVNGQTGVVVLTQDHVLDGATYKQYSQTEKTKLAGIETGADVTDAGNVAAAIDGSAAKTTPVDADLWAILDSAASFVLKKVTFANVKATLKTYFDTVYSALGHTHSSTDVTDFHTAVRTNRLDQMAAPTAAVAMNSQRITGLATPSADTDAATKAYVDAMEQGLDIKDSVRAASTGNLTLSGEQTIDGVAVVTGERVLVKDQSTASQNGIYVVAGGAWSRASDADSSTEVTSGMFCFVEEGTVNADSGWILTTNGAITLGTTSLAFTQFSGAGQITAGAALTKTGNQLDVATDGVGIEVSSDQLRLKDAGVTNAKMANMANATVKGRNTAGTGVPEDVTMSQLKTLLALVKGDVGLGNVDNTSDANKPVSTAQQTALDLKQNILLDGTPNADHSADGPQSSTFNAGESVTVMDLVYLKSDGEWWKTDADAAATADGLLAISLETKSDGQAMKVALPGSFVRDDTWNWTVGGKVYIDTATAGALTQTAPTGEDDVSRIVGWAVTADIIYFMPGAAVVYDAA